MKRFILKILLIMATCSGFAQQDLEDYIPFESTALWSHPPIQIKVVAHVMKKTFEDPENFVEDSLAYINHQYVWVNEFYKKLLKPVLKTADGKEHYIPDSRIEFVLDTVLFHTDENGWDRVKTVSSYNPKRLIDIKSYNEETNEIEIEGRWRTRLKRIDDSLIVSRSGIGNNVYQYTFSKEENGSTFLKLKQKFNPDSLGIISFYKELDKNCKLDNWAKYTDSDETHLHVFYTGSSRSGVSFGCGPRPYFLNLTNMHFKGGGWAAAKLTAHELGHTIGLSHTDRPQFDDLPSKDKFGWIPCDGTKVSNNIMGYNTCRDYLSPKQVGYVHKLYTTRKKRIILTTANEYNPYHPIEIWGDTTWTKAMVIRNDIIIRRGSSLTLTKQVHMAEGATIYVEAKASLIVDGAVVTNFFDTQWGGVVICKSYERSTKLPCLKKNIGTQIFENKGRFENFVE